MGDKIVQVPGIGNVSFPGTMGDDEISAAIVKSLGDSPAASPNAGLSLPAGAPPSNLADMPGPQFVSNNAPRPWYQRALGINAVEEGPAYAKTLQDMREGMQDFYSHDPGGMYAMGIASNLGQAGEDFSQRQVKKGLHSTIKGAGIAALPLSVPAIAAAGPLATATTVGGGMLGSGVGSQGARVLGASEDTQNLAGDIGGILGGIGGNKFSSILTKALPNKAAAGALFNEAQAAAGKNPIDLSKPGNVALEIDRLAQSGGSRPKVISDFLRRTTDPNKGPLTYAEARQFYQNATRLSANEQQRLTPNMNRLIGQFTRALGQAIGDTAEGAGVGPQYQGAMQQYRRAAKFEDFQNMLKAQLLKQGSDWLPPAVGTGILYKLLTSQKSR